MARSKSLVWKGKELTAKMRQAQRDGIDETMADAVIHAKNNHHWKYQKGTLEGSIGIAEFAQPKGGGVEGVWGSQDVKYARIHELGGVIEHPGGTPFYIAEDGMARFVSLDDPRAADLPKTKPHDITIPARPYLRPAADAEYPNLAANIRAALKNPGRRGGGGTKN